MKLNNKEMIVCMPWSENIIFTPKDQVFGVPGYDIGITFICIKESVRGEFDLDHFAPKITKAYAERIRTYVDYQKASRDELIDKNALMEIMEYSYGNGFNIEGKIEILPNGTDLNSIILPSRWRLDPEYSYKNLPVSLTNGDFCYLETLHDSESNAYLQSVVILKGTESRSSWRYKLKSANYSSWQTFSPESEVNEFINFYNEKCSPYIELLNYCNSLLKALNNTSAAIVHSIRGKAASLITNVTTFLDGYYEVIFTSNHGIQYRTSFCADDLQYMKFEQIGTIELCNDTDDAHFFLELSGGKINLRLSILDNPTGNLRIVRLPLKYGEDG